MRKAGLHSIHPHLGLSLSPRVSLDSLHLHLTLSWLTHGGEPREGCGEQRRRPEAGANGLRLLRQQAGEPAVLQCCRSRPWKATGELVAE